MRRAVTEAGPTPTVRAGSLYIPAGHGRGLTRVVVRLDGEPLAAWGGRSLQSATRTKLNTRSASSQAYLARLAAAQRTAVARIERAIPEARVQQRYRVVLNGFTVELPTRQLPRLLKLGFIAQVYPNVRYTLATNRSPDVIRAAAFSSLRGLHGEGMKIGIVDDGVDNRSPFLQGTGYSYPAGFPRGGRTWVNGKIIVARAFPGPNSGRQGREAFVPNISFHGTHVAGIAAGNAGTIAQSGPDHPSTPGLSGVAPRAWIGNYRVFNAPTPIGYVANAAEIIEAFEAAVQDGMDVINFSGGGAMSEPAADPILEAVGNVARAGVVPVISAGNDRDEFGFGTVGSPGVAEDAISVAAVSNTHVFAPPLHVVAADAPVSLQTMPMAAAFDAPATDQQRTLIDVTTIMGRNGRPVDAHLCGLGLDPNDPSSNPLPAGSLTGMVALASRGSCTFLSKAQRAQAAGAIGLILADNRFGEANAIPLQLPVPAAMIADLDGERLRAYLAQKGGRTIISAGRGPTEIVTGRSGIVTSFSSAAPTNFGHSLKPDVAAPGGQILSSTSPESAGGGSPFAVFDGTSMSAPHVAGAAALLLQAHPTWTPRQTRSAFVSTAGPAWGNTARTQEAPVVLQGGGLVDVVRADQPYLFTSPVSLVVRRHRRQPRPADARARDAARRRGRRSGHVVGRVAPAGGVGGRDGRARSAGHDPTRRKRPARRDRPRTCRCSRRRQLRLHRAAPRRHHPPHPVLLRGHAARARAPARRAASRVQHGRHARRRLPREHVPLPLVAVRPAGRLSVRRGDDPGRRGGPLHRADRRAGRQLRRRRVAGRRRRADRPVDPGLAGRERRPGAGRDAGQREQLHLRLPARRRRGGTHVPAAEALLDLGRLRA